LEEERRGNVGWYQLDFLQECLYVADVVGPVPVGWEEGFQGAFEKAVAGVADVFHLLGAGVVPE
jgi:hypothetical protein